MISSTLASFIVELNWEQVPLNIIEKAKYCFIDFLGVSLRGSREQSSQIAWKVLNSINKSSGDSEELVTILGHGRGSLLEACLINGISSHVLDLDDGHARGQVHPGCAVISSALALAEYYDKTGKNLLEAIITGYEVEISLGILINPQHRNKGFHSTGTLGVFGAAAAASKIIGLDTENIINALGLAGTQSCGLLESDHSGSMAKHLHAGHAAQAGVLSALMAQKEFTGSSTIFEGLEGFLPGMCNLDRDEKELSSIINSLLGQFHIKDVYFKNYPVCRHLHSSIESGLHIFNEFKLKKIPLDQIDDIIVQTYKIAAKHDNYYPQKPEATRQSLPVTLAIALTKGDIKVEDIKSYSQLSPEVRRLTSKIRIEVDEDLDKLYPTKRPSRVKIIYHKKNTNKITSPGYVIEKTNFNPAGEIENPLSQKELRDKFYLLNPHLERVNLKLLNDLEGMPIRALMRNFNK